MKNNRIKNQQKQDKQLKKIRDMYIEIIQNLFSGREGRKQRGIYNRKVEKVGMKKFLLKSQNFVHSALEQLRAHFKELRLSPEGRILNPKKIGNYFNALFRIVANNVDLFVIYDESQLDGPHLPLSRSYKEEFRKIVARGEAAAVLLVKHPPEETALEIRRVSEKSLQGLMSLWTNEHFQKTSDIRENLRDYLQHATVKVLHTGYDPEVAKITGSINQHLEKHGGFEDTHWIRVVKGVAQDEKKESLKHALGVCIPIVVVIKIVEHVLPNILHAVGGVLDDLFGAIIPDVSQSMGDRHLPFSERSKKAWPVLKGGLITLPLAFAMGWFSAKLYGMSASVVIHMLAGVLFALACCAGTLGTSIAAFRKSYTAIGKLQEDKKHAYLVSRLSDFEKIKLAFNESIMDVPFRMGHTVIGVPFQIVLGIAAGAFGFFHSTLFIMVEGMAETLFGSATTFVYSYIARLKRNSHLRHTKF
ncbi:MAG: hypothetical protein JSV88_21995 [Candidatus Aminicenantes bacterium]|nr:MAG: hypothetical protein JSV88_21995 [Candidatus Aminicenantes bacterium]